MSPENIARVIVYGAVAMPALLFVALYLLHLPWLRKTTEGIHLLLFTATIGFIAVDFGAALAAGWWDFSLGRFLVAMSIISTMLWQRLYLLLKLLVIPRWRRRRAARRGHRETVAQQVD
jgi:hypothetical protein